MQKHVQNQPLSLMHHRKDHQYQHSFSLTGLFFWRCLHCNRALSLLLCNRQYTTDTVVCQVFNIMKTSTFTATFKAAEIQSKTSLFGVIAFDDFAIPETADDMIVDKPYGLDMGVYYRGSDKLKPPALKVFADFF